MTELCFMKHDTISNINIVSIKDVPLLFPDLLYSGIYFYKDFLKGDYYGKKTGQESNG
jgi:hypothetical protein